MCKICVNLISCSVLWGGSYCYKGVEDRRQRKANEGGADGLDLLMR